MAQLCRLGVGVSIKVFYFGSNFAYHVFSPVAPMLIVLCTVVLLLGAKEYSFINTVITTINISIIIAIIGVGAWKFDSAKWNNFMGPNVALGTAEDILSGKTHKKKNRTKVYMLQLPEFVLLSSLASIGSQLLVAKL